MTSLLACKQGGAPAAFSALLTFFSAAETFSSDSSGPAKAELIASAEPGWPQFRGPRRDGRSDERGLLRSWPQEGPRKIWSATKLGRGFSSPVIVNGQIFLTGDTPDELQITALDLAGQTLWKAGAGAPWRSPYPGARATPAFSAGRLYLQNAHGEIRSFDAKTGQGGWTADLLGRFGGKNITWGLSECLLVDDRAVYATAGGREALVVALDKATGEVLWKSEALHDTEGDRSLENASYVSPILFNFNGRRLLAGCSLRHLFCIDADTGQIQWTRRLPTTYSVLAMTPVLTGDAIFMTAPHGKPGGLFRLVAPREPGGKIGFEQSWETRLDTCQGGVVELENRLIGSFYPGRKGWAAIDRATGEVLYDAPDIVKGAALYADGRLYVLSENGWMYLLESGQDRFTSHGRFRLASTDNDAWAHLRMKAI